MFKESKYIYTIWSPHIVCEGKKLVAEIEKNVRV